MSNERVSKVTGCNVTGYQRNTMGFTFIVFSELDAYKSAYMYRSAEFTEVNKLPVSNRWMVYVSVHES